jgi:hypothetical protein
MLHSLPSVSISKMLCYSDGLSESLMHGGKIYGSCLKDDFIDSICVKDFRDKVAMHIGQGDELMRTFSVKILKGGLLLRMA